MDFVCGEQRVPTAARRPRRAIACWMPRAVRAGPRRPQKSGSAADDGRRGCRHRGPALGDRRIRERELGPEPARGQGGSDRAGPQSERVSAVELSTDEATAFYRDALPPYIASLPLYAR